LVEDSVRKSSCVYSVKGLAKKTPALFTRASTEPNRFSAVPTIISAVGASPMSPSFGELEDSSVVATRIGGSVRYVVAATDYLQGRKLPLEPADLKRHDCVMLNARNNETDWDLVYGRKKALIHVCGQISSRDFISASTFVYRGHGIGPLPSTYCDEGLASGALIRLLPKWASPQIPVFAVYTNRKFLPLRLNVFLEALAIFNSAGRPN
jgi:DNA-binding transcriptional LysR family regulator